MHTFGKKLVSAVLMDNCLNKLHV